MKISMIYIDEKNPEKEFSFEIHKDDSDFSY